MGAKDEVFEKTSNFIKLQTSNLKFSNPQPDSRKPKAKN